MSKFRIKQIKPGKKSLKYRTNETLYSLKSNVKPYIYGLATGLVIAFLVWANAVNESNSIQKRLFKTFESFSIRGEVHAQEPEETVIEGVEKDKKAYVKRVLSESTAFYFGKQHVEPMLNLIQSESGFNPEALNKKSGACGLGQALPCGKMQCAKDDVPCQVSWVIGYIEDRYGNPTNAWKHWQSRVKVNGKDLGNWY